MSTRDQGADSLLLIDIVHAVLNRCGAGRWAITPSDAWCQATPPEVVRRKHGWKLHVSATPLSAPLVLARAAEVLARQRCSFKFGTDLRRVAELVDMWYDRGGAGKFITAYPRDDEHFRAIADELHRATAGLAGPTILSDRQLRRGSLVHYRYGQFSADRVLTDDGMFEPRMTGPDGCSVTDERKAWFSPPAWASPPFAGESGVVESAPESVMLGGRFRIRKAIRHANKGGVFRAFDERDGSEVVIKQARAHVGARLNGRDGRDRLRTEARMLDVIGPAIAPRKVALFEEEDDLFLVEESVPGTTLNRWAADWVNEGGLGAGSAREMAHRVLAVVQSLHQAGLVICDLKPHNLMVCDTGEIRLVDVEYVAEPGQGGDRGATPGFAAPEFLTALERGDRSVPEPAADCFSLGVTLFCMLTDLPPEWVSARTGTRATSVERRRLLLQIGTSHPALLAFVDVIVGLTEPDTARRWTLKRAEEFLLDLDAPARPNAVQACATKLAPARELDRLITDGLIHIQRGMTPHKATLWPGNPVHGRDIDACTAWTGAAGTLATLTRAARILGDASLTETVRQAALWVDERLFAVPRFVPGLGVGRGGTAWALHDAALLLGDDRLAARALELASRLPVQGPSPDIHQGLSGAGMLHLHLWQVTGDPGLLRRALVYAEAVLAAAQPEGAAAWTWPTSPEADSKLAGKKMYGYAHGIAGAGAFLLAAAQAVGGQCEAGSRLMQAALGAGDTLTRAARVDGRQRTCWPLEVGGENGFTQLWWCSGPTGVGDFLIRLWTATGQQRFADLAEQAAASLMADPWRATHGACCGLAGGGQFLLDMADITGQERYRAHADDLAGVIEVRHIVHDGLRLTGEPTSGTDYASGSAGILDFLLRLRHGGQRPWMPQR